MTATPHIFECSLDREATILSIVCWLTPIASLFILLLVSPQRFTVLLWVVFLISALPAILLIFLRPRSYVVDDTSLTIERWIGDMYINQSDVVDIGYFNLSEMGSITRTFGSGGGHGYFGYFKSSVKGKLMYQATRRNTLLILTRESDIPVVLSPDEPDLFLGMWKKSSE